MQRGARFGLLFGFALVGVGCSDVPLSPSVTPTARQFEIRDIPALRVSAEGATVEAPVSAAEFRRKCELLTDSWRLV